jgi:orotidine-5'-phosphate decarboxylase
LRPFISKLANASQKNRSWLCIGLDLDPALMPEVKPLEFGRAIIDATRDLVCAYKPNLAFYEALGIEGLRILEQLTEHIPSHIPIIGDAKRGDISNTARAYAKALFCTFGFDAATVNPYLGFDSVEPFISYQDKGVFVLCRTSNPGASDFQDLRSTAGFSLYEEVARKAREWNVHGNIGLVVGATYPEELRKVRSICPEMPFLIPGIGAQGADLASAVNYGMDARGEKAIVTVSRQIIYASKEGDFAEAARNMAERIREQINNCLAARPDTGRC